MEDQQSSGQLSVPRTRQATMSDLPVLVRLFEAYRSFYQMPGDPHGAEVFLADLLQKKLSVIYLIESGLEVYGFVQLYPLFSSTRMQRLWLLNDLFVEEKSRGRGYSRQLIEVAKIHARDSGACGLQLETQRDNLVANQLYMATGFEVDKNHNYYFWSTR